MPQQSILSPSDSDTTSVNSVVQHPVVSILGAEESQLKESMPSFLKHTVAGMASPTELFSDYAKTGEPMLKEAAANAWQALKTAVTEPHRIFGNTVTYNRDEEVQKAIPETVPASLKDPMFTVSNKYGISAQLLAQQLNKENKKNDAKAVNHNSDGSKDLGLMQINSRMIPYITNEFAKQGRKFNWQNPNDSIEAAAILHKQNKNVLKNYGIEQTDKNLFDAYNVGPKGLKKALAGNAAATSAVEAYNNGTMFQE